MVLCDVVARLVPGVLAEDGQGRIAREGIARIPAVHPPARFSRLDNPARSGQWPSRPGRSVAQARSSAPHALNDAPTSSMTPNLPPRSRNGSMS